MFGRCLCFWGMGEVRGEQLLSDGPLYRSVGSPSVPFGGASHFTQEHRHSLELLTTADSRAVAAWGSVGLDALQVRLRPDRVPDFKLDLSLSCGILEGAPSRKKLLLSFCCWALPSPLQKVCGLHLSQDALSRSAAGCGWSQRVQKCKVPATSMTPPKFPFPRKLCCPGARPCASWAAPWCGRTASEKGGVKAFCSVEGRVGGA